MALRSAAGFGLLERHHQAPELILRQGVLDQREEHPLLVADVALEALAKLPQRPGRLVAPSSQLGAPPPQIDMLNEHADDGLVVRGRVRCKRRQ
jgi:hypothetical protein